jgi:hypothetical protein
MASGSRARQGKGCRTSGCDNVRRPWEQGRGRWLADSSESSIGRGRGRGFRQGVAKPFGDGVDRLANPQAAQDLFVETGDDQGGEDAIAGALLATQLFDLGAQAILGLADGNIINTLDILLRLAPGARRVSITLVFREARMSQMMKKE